MTASLPNEVQSVFEHYQTSELTTVDAAGQPVTWPVMPYYVRGAPCVDVTTGLGYPKKADDASANPLVALLFSDSTGCGLADPPMVLVQGTAHVDDRDCTVNRERYAQESIQKLAGTAKRIAPRPLRQMLSWYYSRIYIHVRPERVYVWPRGDGAAEPQLYDAHMEEVRSGHSEEPPRFHATPVGGASTWDPRIAELGGRYRTAVLSLVSPDGFPFAIRLPVTVDEPNRRIRIEGAPTGVPFAPGLACLTAHAYANESDREHNFQLRGDLVYADGAWALVPHQLVGGSELPPSQIAVLRAGVAMARRVRATAKRELARRT
ncbi:MAG: hypothetical protein ABSG43_07380 [Solirubrobacteraceae bacterium]